MEKQEAKNEAKIFIKTFEIIYYPVLFIIQTVTLYNLAFSIVSLITRDKASFEDTAGFAIIGLPFFILTLLITKRYAIKTLEFIFSGGLLGFPFAILIIAMFMSILETHFAILLGFEVAQMVDGGIFGFVALFINFFLIIPLYYKLMRKYVPYDERNKK